MRIAFDVSQTGVERAGCAWFADGLARALATRADVQVDIYPHFDRWINSTSANATSAPGARLMLADTTPDAAASFWAAAASTGLPGQPDIVHANSFQAPQIANTRLVFTVHDLCFWSHPSMTSEATRQHCQRGMLDALERAAGLVFVSEAARDEFECILPGWLDQSARPWAVVPGASRFRGQTADRPVSRLAPWLCVGSVEPRKNHETLLQAYSHYCDIVPNPRPLHLIGGRGWHSEDTHNRIARIAASYPVRYHGYVPEDELLSAYRAAFALIQPSWHEGFGLPVVEAMSQALPLVCSDIPALREVAGPAAAYFPPGSIESLTKIMIELDSDPCGSGPRSARSLERSTRFSWDSSAQRCVDLYQRILR